MAYEDRKKSLKKVTPIAADVTKVYKDKPASKRLAYTKKKGATTTYIGKDNKPYPSLAAKNKADSRYEEHVGRKQKRGEHVADPAKAITKGQALQKAKRKHSGKQLRWDAASGTYKPIN